MSNSNPIRVVITGMGLVSPLGNSKESLWDALAAGRSGVGPIQRLPSAQLPVSFAGEARDFSGHINDFGPLEKDQKRTIRKGLKVMCREIQMGVASAQLALGDAGLHFGDCDPDRTGVVYGSDYILTEPEEFTEGIRSCLSDGQEFDLRRWPEVGMAKVTPLWLLKYLPNMPASHIAIYNDLRGPNNSITLREASANLAVAEAYCTIARGKADAMLAGATGSRLHPLRTVHVALQEELANAEVPPAEQSRPFDLKRTGMVIGEGAAAILVENYDSAVKRGAPILAEIVGFGSTAVMDRAGVGQTTQAIENVCLQSLEKAGMKASDLGHVHAHGLSTHKGDREEAAAIAKVFGDSTVGVPVTAAKSYMGNLGAASGMVELIASVMALKKGQLFPILNYSTPDPDCPIRAVPEATDLPGSSFLNINITPQGQASGILARSVA